MNPKKHCRLNQFNLHHWLILLLFLLLLPFLLLLLLLLILISLFFFLSLYPHQTHAISGIIQVAQDVDEPWYLQIQNHQGEEQELELSPRDFVLYESAACIHGRETPLKGRYYANVFVHL
jgi:hypothetical protein